MTTDTRPTFGEELNTVLAVLEDEERFHQHRLQQIREDKECVLHSGHLSLRMQAGMVEEGRMAGYGLHSHIKPADLAHVRRLWDAYIEIALRSNGFVHCRSAARLVLASRLSSSSVETFAGTVYKSLKDSTDFVYYSPRVFRYTPFPNTGTAQPDRRISTADRPASPYWQKDVGGGDPS